MSVIVQMVALADGFVPPQAGAFLRSWDLDAHGGRGDVAWTADRAQAYKFPDAAEAMRVLRMRSKVRPLRPDGKPNRPLTAFTVAIEQA